MSGIRVLVGTKKGAFILTSDGNRKQWTVNGPLFAGWELYHLKGSPVDPNRLYASQTSSWFGQVIQRSDDGGKTWTPAGHQTRRFNGPGRHAEGREQYVCSTTLLRKLANRSRRTSITTARSVHGNSNGCGISNRR